jgi:hypothetical protein
MTRRALLVCYYFPPMGLSGIARPMNLFKRLGAYGYDCEVLTVKSVAYRALAPELLQGLNAEKIYRSGSFDPQRLLYLSGMRKAGHRSLAAGRATSERFFPDSKRGWVGPAVRLGKKLAAADPYDVIISTSPPISSHLVGLRLSLALGIPWIADFRDFWTSRRLEATFRSQSQITRGRVFLDEIGRRAVHLVGTSQSVVDYVGGGTVITNGYDATIAARWRAPSPPTLFSIGLLGTFNDLVPVAPLVSVLEKLRPTAGGTPPPRIVQVGYTDPDWLRAQFTARGLDHEIVSHGLQSGIRTVELLSECACCYVGLASDDETAILPGRMFDLLASGRPILAHVPDDSEIANLVKSTSEGCCFQKQTVDHAVAFLSHLHERYAAGSLTLTPCPVYARPYTWDSIVRQYAQLLDSVLPPRQALSETP